ncbi:hypothetical protein SHL15_5621 [Streptomyces hygroscopicus subsp. limoneus]|nr:hypothetical protein SHL15_5621 [Streptomyces hygroscopicus subsp. limoneus]
MNVPPAGPGRGRPHHRESPHIPAPDRTPPPITASRTPRLAAALFRRYLRSVVVGSREHPIPLTGARPEAVLSEASRLGRRR